MQDFARGQLGRSCYRTFTFPGMHAKRGPRVSIVLYRAVNARARARHGCCHAARPQSGVHVDDGDAEGAPSPAAANGGGWEAMPPDLDGRSRKKLLLRSLERGTERNKGGQDLHQKLFFVEDCEARRTFSNKHLTLTVTVSGALLEPCALELSGLLADTEHVCCRGAALGRGMMLQRAQDIFAMSLDLLLRSGPLSLWPSSRRLSGHFKL